MSRWFAALLGRPSAGRAPGDDHRRAHRYPATGNEARVGWWSEGVFNEVAARVRDISQGGALLSCEGPPPLGDAYVRLGPPHATEWAAAKVIRSKRVSDGSHRVGVLFPDGCPYGLFTELLGSRIEERAEPESPEFEERSWR